MELASESSPATLRPPNTVLGAHAADSSVLESLRGEIDSCALLPGDRLKFDELRSRFQISVGTLREALTILESEGLVRSEKNRGFSVAPVSVRELLDITDMRVELELKALRLSLAHGNEEWEAELVSAWHLLSKVQDARASGSTFEPTWAHRHERFHHALVMACPSEWTLRFRALLFRLAHRYLCLAARYRAGAQSRGFGEHAQLLEFALKREVDSACRLMEQHIRATTDSIIAKVSGNI